MATSDQYLEAIQIVNEVQRKLGVGESSFFDDNKLTTVIKDFLNDVISECNDYGSWPQFFREIDVTASSSVEAYEIPSSANVHHIYEIHFDTQVSPLEVKSVEDMRRLQRTRGFGEPRQFAVVNTSAANPIFRAYPIPGANENNKVFDIAYYKKQRLLTTVSADTSAIVLLPSRMLVQGVYAKTLLEESGQEATPHYQVAYQEYLRMRRESLNRLTADTGTDLFFVPTGGY
jgi:hypothetical protein